MGFCNVLPQICKVNRLSLELITTQDPPLCLPSPLHGEPRPIQWSEDTRCNWWSFWCDAAPLSLSIPHLALNNAHLLHVQSQLIRGVELNFKEWLLRNLYGFFSDFSLVLRCYRENMCFVFQVGFSFFLHRWIMLSSEVVTQAGRRVHFRETSVQILSAQYTARSVFIHISFIGDRNVTRRQVLSRHWSYLLC